jgi:hypothetical protein
MYLEAWGQADWLMDLVKERLASVPHDERELRSIAKQAKSPNQLPNTPFLQSLRGLETNLARQRYDNERQEAVEERLRDEFVLKRRQPYARREGDENSFIAPIPIDFWPGAKFHSYRNAVSRYGVVFVDVRVVSVAAEVHPNPALEAHAQPAADKAKAKSGPKSKELFIRMAITHCSSTVDNWGRLNLPRRVSHYKKFLRNVPGSKVDEETGYSPKTFEKFEGKMRDEAGR